MKLKEKFMRKLMLVIAGFTCFIAIILCFVVVSTSHNMRENVTDVYEHPYSTASGAWEMRSRLLDMKQFAVLFLTDPSNNEEDLLELFQHRYDLQDATIQEIRKSYMGPKSDLDALQTAMNNLKTNQNATVEGIFKRISEGEEISDIEMAMLFEENVYPYYDALNDKISVILTFADAKILELEKQASTTAVISIVSVIVFSVMIIVFALYLVKLESKRHQSDVDYREKIFDLLSNHVDDVIMIHDIAKQEFEYISPNIDRILGISAEDFVGPQVMRPHILEEDLEKFDALVDINLDAPTPQTERVVRYRKEDSEQYIWLSIKVIPLKKEDVVDRYIVTLSDQSENMSVQFTLREALAVAQNANNAKKSFLSRMSHEIRTPMNAIIGMTTIAAAYIGDQKRVEDCLTKITLSSKHLLSLINDVLDMSKIEEDKLVKAHEPFEFKDLVESITSIIYSQTASKDLNFEVLIDCSEEVLIGDSVRVSQILLNLLSNAVKFTPTGGNVRFEIRETKRKSGSVYIRFTVSDTGIGMSEEFLKKLYDPFEQEETGTSGRGGTGLGMPITKNLVALLGGTIEVKSEKGKGTQFTVELPFDLPEEKKSERGESEIRDLNVLVVDDDKDTCIHADILLKKMGVRSSWVLSGAEAIPLVLNAHETGNDYDVCIIDWKMPEMDGIETTRQIRKIVGSEALIIILSAYDWSSIEKEAREAGANAFISKPMFAFTLYNTLVSVSDKNKIAETATPKSPEYSFKGKRILLAEDNELNTEIAVEILKMTEVEVDCAHNGRVAVDRYLATDAHFYDMILMDIQMPIMNGYEAARAIRESGREDAKSIPIFAMTANAFNEDVIAATESGMNGHIAKPIDVDVLYKILSANLNKKP